MEFACESWLQASRGCGSMSEAEYGLREMHLLPHALPHSVDALMREAEIDELQLRVFRLCRGGKGKGVRQRKVQHFCARKKGGRREGGGRPLSYGDCRAFLLL
jgi:hypothetical protein